MIPNSAPDVVNNIILALALLWIFAGTLYKKWRRKNRLYDQPNSPILLTHYTDGTHLIPAKKGTFGDLRYSAFLALSRDLGSPENSNSLIFRVELPFATKIHLLGIPIKTGAVRLDPTKGKSIMEHVNLEGHYNQYFDLFCEKDMQQLARYVLDPKAMVFTLDFCQSQNWELVGNELYFVTANGMKDPNDPTSLIEDIQTFVKEIRPAIETPLTDHQKALLTPYGDDRKTDLECPYCNTILHNNSKYFVCMNGHGILVSAKNIPDVRKSYKFTHTSSVQDKKETDIKCPSCNNPMNKVKFGLYGKTTIDSCSNCPYRWLDGGEYKPVTIMS